MTLSVRIKHSFAGFSLDVAFDAAPGVTVLFGRSGSGKTTVVNAVAGLLRPDHGRIEAAGAVLLDTEARVNLPPSRRRIGYVFQDARLFPHLTVRQNLRYGRWFAPKGAGVEEGRVIEMLGIGALLDRRPGLLSGGEKQRVALGRAILSNPRLLLMDEPLAALDEERKAEILPYLERLRDEVNLPILYVSHAPSEVARLATTVVMLESGRLRAAGPAAAVLSDPETALRFGRREAGALIVATVTDRAEDGLIMAETAGGPVWLSVPAGPPGQRLRLRILARDVMLALRPPEGVSALNVLSGAVVGLIEGDDAPEVTVRIAMAGEILLARITRRSAKALGLSPGVPVYAVVKAVSIAEDGVAVP